MGWVSRVWVFILDSCMDDYEAQKYDQQLQLFDMTELVWHLCEILFIDTVPGKELESLECEI